MKELNISRCIIQKRKEKGITQEQLAEYIGVSKASVSKWESGLSYPDILFLPELATYFNVSVDELLGYSPQLTKEDIKRLYNKLSHEFATKPFEEAMELCNEKIKKYYSCFPFLLAMIQLLLNHCVLAKTEEARKEILQQCIFLCKRVKDEGEDISHIKNANAMEAMAAIGLGNSGEVISLLNDKLDPYIGEDLMLINAYQMQGDTATANKVNQILLYQSVIDTLSLLTNYLSLHMMEPIVFEQVYFQGVQIIDSFQMKGILTNAVFAIHIVAAQGYMIHHEKEKAVKALEQYVDIVCGFEYPLKLKGNEFFNQVDEWLEDNISIGTNSPLDEITNKKNFINMIAENPAFIELREDEKYKLLINKIKRKLGEK
jgi:transcriptional regulator with XRE-family HTH domain